MRKNVGGFDRMFRMAVGLAVIGIGLIYQSWWGALGLIPLLTGVFSWCPVYLPYGTSTYKEPKHMQEPSPRSAA